MTLPAASLLSPEILASLSEFLQSALFIAQGCGYTVALILLAMSIGLAVGLPLSAFQVYGPKWTKYLAGLYIWFFRGIPILVLMFMIYFGFFNIIESAYLKWIGQPLTLSPFLASILALGLASGAYQSQIFKGAILSLPSGQFRAARALGFSRTSAIVSIVLPQAMRISIPAWSNEYSILLKDSAVAYVLGTMEIMARTRFMSSLTFTHTPYYLLAGLLYYLLTWLGVKMLNKLDKMTRIPGLCHDLKAEDRLQAD